MHDVILAIDEGTTNAKVVCVDRSGAIVSRGSRPLVLSHPQPGWTEQDPLAILAAVGEAAAEAIAALASGVRVAGIAISNQRESVVAWDRLSGEPASPVIVWQCRRSGPFCTALAAGPEADTVRDRTGLPIDPLFPAAKMRWLIDHIENGRARAEAGELCIGTIDSWLAWHLSGGEAFVTDASNASRTQLLSLASLSWDEDLLGLFGVPAACLATVMSSTGERGRTCAFPAIPDGLPLLSQIGDSHAALYGQGGFLGGVTKATYGTGSSLMTPIDGIGRDDRRLARTVAWHDRVVRYALEGNITHTGAAVEYMARLLGLGDAAAVAALARTVPDTEGVHFVPALSGLGAPHWASDARGLVTGLTERAGPAHLARASLEAIAYQIGDVCGAMEQLAGRSLERLLVDGGPTRNRWLMQFQANVLGREVARASEAEVSALGAAYLAGMAVGWWSTHEELAALHREPEIIEPDSDRQRVQDGQAGWQQAVRLTLASA